MTATRRRNSSQQIPPFYVSGKGFIPATELYVGDELCAARTDGSEKIHRTGIIEKILPEVAREPVKVYNFQVEDLHTYHVGLIGVWGHNMCQANSEIPKENAESPKKMLGTDGTQVSSKTTWKNGVTERIDVENPSPGRRPGQIHYHDSKNRKYIYDIDKNIFYDLETNKEAPDFVQKLLKNKNFLKGIEKALKILGE